MTVLATLKTRLFTIKTSKNLGLRGSWYFIGYTPGYPSKSEWDLTNGPLSKLLGLLDTQVLGSNPWVLLEISWRLSRLWFHTCFKVHPENSGEDEPILTIIFSEGLKPPSRTTRTVVLGLNGL